MRVVNRDCLIEFVDEYYKQQQSICFFCKDKNCPGELETKYGVPMKQED